MKKSFSETGYIVLKNAISIRLIKDIQSEIYNLLEINEDNENKKYLKFCDLVNKLKISEFDFVKPIFEYIYYKGLIEKILLEKNLYNSIVNLLGKDLSFCNDHSITLNLPNKDSPKKNYLFKDWHQEIWSGASSSTIQIWTPLIKKDRDYGKLKLKEESHKWGHIPHMDRKPMLLPKNYKTKILNLEYGDIIIFSTLLLHRSVPTKSPLLSSQCKLVRVLPSPNFPPSTPFKPVISAPLYSSE